MSNFIVNFSLKTLKFQEDILEKRFEIARKIYNSLLGKTEKRYKQMVRTKEYKMIKQNLSEVYKSNRDENEKMKKELLKSLNFLYKKYRLSEYEFHSDVKNYQRHFKKNIDSHVAQKIASSLWKAFEKLLYADGAKLHYKRYGAMMSVEGKTKDAGIRIKNDKLHWLGLEIPIHIDYTNEYEYLSMQNEISYLRIVRKFVRRKYKYYVQIVFKGYPPNKKELKIGDVGLDIGTQTLAIASESRVKLLELASEISVLEREKRVILRKLDRSRRAMNPLNYNEDGTIRSQGNKKVKWIKSNRYKKQESKLREIYRKQKDVRKYSHERLANEIISLGSDVYVESMSFKGLQKKAVKTEKDDKGKFKRKKRFGKSIANKAPAMLIEIIDRKLKYHGKRINKIDTWSVKASQYDHEEDSYKKKKLSQRWTEVAKIKLQRDMYSAFLIMNVNSDLKSINTEKCKERFNIFVNMHDEEVKGLRGKKNLSSMSI